MARPTVYDSSLRQRLLETTAELVAKEGPDRVALRDIAAAVGTSTTAVYSLFGGKPQLLTAILDDAFRSFGDSQRAAAPDGLRGLGLAYRRWALEHPAFYALMFSGPLGTRMPCEPTPEIAAASIVPLYEAVGAALAAAGSDDPVEPSVAAIWGQVHGLVSLELSGLGLPGIDWEAAYETALNRIERSYAV
ncbi:TetR family transcriptional regulator [Arthrobacter crystallopoietes BAB-32]|uniref:TetR family transcriptional regulator n=1 Tax=Arthrobacter crystallopoietes BAB-32 TaxID=1246476 RepID=N1UT99_9MICC|nr:TetR/AcrR family transcriptional regulator [Arthrobacter crystallopoietes]EMY33646.1 TetR family transcriptional regulator [Arthrobacter crystallopoietes BAB-32]